MLHPFEALELATVIEAVKLHVLHGWPRWWEWTFASLCPQMAGFDPSTEDQQPDPRRPTHEDRIAAMRRAADRVEATIVPGDFDSIEVDQTGTTVTRPTTGRAGTTMDVAADVHAAAAAAVRQGRSDRVLAPDSTEQALEALAAAWTAEQVTQGAGCGIMLTGHGRELEAAGRAIVEKPSRFREAMTMAEQAISNG